MWDILHWIFIAYAKPHPCMHLIASLVLWPVQYFHHDTWTRKDILPACCIFCIYAAFYMSPLLDHFAFQPWWVVTITGLRYREFLIWLGGIYVGIYLYYASTYTIVAHVVINISSLLKIRQPSLKASAIVHAACLLIFTNDPHIYEVSFKDGLAGISCILSAVIVTPPDIFSMAMIFNSPIGLSTFFLHALEPYWYKFYKNNHFKIVKHSFYFIYPVAIVSLALGYNLMPYLKTVSVYQND